jgi:hypothetical protein
LKSREYTNNASKADEGDAWFRRYETIHRPERVPRTTSCKERLLGNEFALLKASPASPGVTPCTNNGFNLNDREEEDD